MGFLAIDLAKALDLPLFDPNNKNARVADNAHPKAGNGVLGKDPVKARRRDRHQWRIGPDLYSRTRSASSRTAPIKALLEQDYVSGIFVDDELGRFPGTLPMSQLGLKGKAVTPHPVDRGQFPLLVVGMRGADQLLGPDRRHRAAAGPGHARQLQPRRYAELHGGDRPDFKSGYVDALPVSNADVGATAAKIMGLTQKPNGGLIGRVMSEAMPNGATPKAYAGT